MQLRDPELSLQTMQLLKIDRSYDVYDREFARLARDDHKTIGIALINRHIDVDISLFLMAANSNQALPCWRRQLLSDHVYFGARIDKVLVKRETPDVNAF